MEPEVLKNVQDWTERKSPVPLRVEIWPTRLCNLRCKFCDTYNVYPPEHKKSEMTDEQLRQIIRECLTLGVEDFIFSGGGEPWLRGAVLLELMKEITDHGRTGHILTNGTLFSQNDIREIVGMGWGSVMVSMDGPSAAVHDILRGSRGAYDRTLRALRFLVRERRRTGSQGPHLAINFVVTRTNAYLVPQMLRFAAEEGCDQILFQALMDLKDETRMLKLGDEGQQRFVDAAQRGVELAEQLGINTNLREFTNNTILEESREVHKILAEQIESLDGNHVGGIESIPCYEAWRGLSVTPEGKISICGPYAERSEVNVSFSSCESVWGGNHAQGIREMMLSGNITGLCKECCTNRLFENNQLRIAAQKASAVQWSTSQ